jgi:hypothetical protein
MTQTQDINFRKNGIVAGVLLLAAIVTGSVGVAINNSILTAPDVLTQVAIHPLRVTIGALLWMLMAFCCAGIGIWLYPVLKTINPAMAAGAMGFRIMEGTIFIVSATAVMRLVTLASQGFNTDISLVSVYEVATNMLVAENEWLGSVAGALAFCLGALLYYILMIQSRIVPRWLSVWGLAAILSHLVWANLVMFGVNSIPVMPLLMNLPIALNEVVLAIWLIVKGFDLSHMNSASFVVKS